MKALVYQGPNMKSLEDRPKPEITAPSDAIVKVTRTTICGTDLHILKGDVPTCTPERILGHEGVGIVEAVGSAVTAFKAGDPVLISCVSACGKCANCRRQMYSHCNTGGWILGNSIDGTQAEFVRIPHADMSLYRVPAGADEEASGDAQRHPAHGAGVRRAERPCATRQHGGHRRLRAHRPGNPARRTVLFARPDHHDRSRRRSPGRGQALRCDGHHQQLQRQRQRQRGRCSDEADLGPWRRHRHRGRRRARHLRAVPADRRRRRHYRQYWRSRRQGRPAPRKAVGPQRKGTWRVAFWGAFAMAVTAGAGALFGAVA